MKISTKRLIKIVNELPEANYAGEIHPVRVQDVAEMRQHIRSNPPPENETVKVHELIFIAALHANSSIDYWFEWELEI